MYRHLLFFMLAVLFGCVGPNGAPDTRPRVIFDTDMDSDIDDVGALAMLHNLHKQNRISLLGVIVTSDDPFAPTCASALNRHYGHGHLPIGFPENQTRLANHSRYTRQLSEEYPHPLTSWQTCPSATETYRRLLATSPDNAVIIITVGHLSSLQNLLQSEPDSISPLDGKSLVKNKVQKWYCMGGQFPEGKEANFYRPDPASTFYCLENWEKEVVFSGWETGQDIITGDAELKKRLPADHPVYRGYELYNRFAGRASWDQTAVLLLVPQSMDFFEFEDNGKCIVNADGSNYWKWGEKSNHRFLKIKDGVEKSAISEVITDLMTGNSM
ncbi:MAG: nucleoside hydrolase [Tannerella sp.]|jgi:inosine-uridine nucleoside N-ribohydrolase|nr:nucleoside hydrolase [Tannerella sp.]